MEKLIENFKSRRLGVVYILKMVSPEVWDWQPDPSMKTTAQLASHLARSPLSMYKLLNGRIKGIEAYKEFEAKNVQSNAQDLVKIFEEGLKQLTAFLEKHLEDAHEEKINVFYRENPVSIYKEAFEEIGHIWFHLGQLFTYLRQNNITVTMMNYYGIEDPLP